MISKFYKCYELAGSHSKLNLEKPSHSMESAKLINIELEVLLQNFYPACSKEKHWLSKPVNSDYRFQSSIQFGWKLAQKNRIFKNKKQTWNFRNFLLKKKSIRTIRTYCIRKTEFVCANFRPNSIEFVLIESILIDCHIATTCQMLTMFARVFLTVKERERESRIRCALSQFCTQLVVCVLFCNSILNLDVDY